MTEDAKIRKDTAAKQSVSSPWSLTSNTNTVNGNNELPFRPNEPIIQNNGAVQQSSPQHSYRHSRAYRHFKNPPQPHMCIRTTTQTGEEVLINVLSWTRIVIPQDRNDPIPLYGGMRVPSGSPRCPPHVYAVMANPEVLKDSGRHSKDPEERSAMVELMCDFVEAMNPEVKVTRNALILKDRDISGELKDVWNAVQVQRDREREDQINQQRQQYLQNLTTQMFPKVQNPDDKIQQQNDQIQSNDNKIIYMEFGPESSSTKSAQLANSSEILLENKSSCKVEEQSAISDKKDVHNVDEKDSIINEVKTINSQTTIINQIDQTIENSLKTISITGASAASNTTTVNDIKTKPITATTNSTTSSTSTTNTTTTTATLTKKDKKTGFLPNGCIFPRFKNNKNQDKVKDKDKEKDKSNNKQSSKDKERTLLNSLKSKNKAKYEESGKSQYDKNCINLESEVEKLDLNKIDDRPSPKEMCGLESNIGFTTIVQKYLF